jgi:hypothetical protein
MSVPHNFRYFKTSPEITCLFVMMCLHYPLSLQTIEACSTSGSNLTFESCGGFPLGLLCGNLAHAHGNIHYCFARRSSATFGFGQGARIVIESWHRYYNTVRHHSSLHYRPPAPRGRAMAGCATRTSFAGHPSIEAKAFDALTSTLDHLMGSGHKLIDATEDWSFQHVRGR